VKSIAEYAELLELFNPKGLVEDAEIMILPGK
jgi:hypothetical protein